MATLFNIYCDETCHLENDGHQVMALGCVWVAAAKVPEIHLRLREIREKHDLPKHFEIKWTKVSPGKLSFYQDILDYFFYDDDLHFRGIVIPDKSKLDHTAYDQTHDGWYYKMMFRMLEVIIQPKCQHAIYLDIKDTHSYEKCMKLQKVIRNANRDGDGDTIGKIQPVRSDEIGILQIADLVTGLICHACRGLQTSPAKQALIERFKKRSGLQLSGTTYLQAKKVNLLFWRHGLGRGANA